MKIYYFLLSLFFGFSQLAAQNPTDSLFATLKTTTDEKIRVDLLLKISYSYRTSDLSKSKLYLDSGVTFARELGYKYGLAYANYISGTLDMDGGNYHSAISKLQSALFVIAKDGSPKDLEDIYNNLGISYKRSGNIDSANYCYSQALNYVQDSYGKGRLLINIGSNYIALGKLDSAASYQLQAIKIFEELENHNALAIAYLNLGNIHYKKEDYEWALDGYKQSLKSAIKANHKLVQSRNYLNIGTTYSFLGYNDSSIYYFSKAVPLQLEMNDKTGLAASYRNIGEAFLLNSKIDSAKKYLLLSKDIYNQTEHIEGLSRINKFLANLYFQQQELPLALSYIDQSIDYATKGGLLHETQKAYDLKHQIHSQIHDFDNAYKALLIDKELSDSIFNQEKVALIDELQTKYETEQKDNEIASLSQQAQIQQLLINQRNIQLIGAGIILLLLILGGSFYYQQRKIRHQKSVSELEQRMLRLQMNPHFIFNALASIQNYILKNDTKESVQYLSKFGRLMRQILEHSRQEYITVAEEIDMLKNYLSIQQLRFRQLKKYTIDVDPELDAEEVRIPPLFTQPFVENALEHGLVDTEKEGEITIHIRLETNDEVSIEVIDNGQGVIAAATAEKSHQSLATSITRERIALLSRKYKRHFNLEVGSNSMGGTTARLIVPGQV